MTQDAIADFATWNEPETAFQVQYSLPVFHEIDNEVVDGYRRIPHGGIEVGGLLFGRHLPNGVRIEAFRQIQCEHALGPSFKLSDHDLALLHEQIERADHDPELGGLETLGWFISHTRGPLELTETEAALFEELLPGTGMLTLLVKPEKFKPTLFAFLVRGSNSRVSSGGADRAFILPLPGQSAAIPQAIPSPTPAVPVAPPPAHTPRVTEPITERKIPARPIFPPELQPEPAPPVWIQSEPAPRPLAHVEKKPEFVPAFQPPPAGVTPLSPPQPERFERPAAFTPPVAPQFDTPPRPPVAAAPSSTEIPAFTRPIEPQRKRSGMLTVIVLAAILGAAAGYWFYQQMSPTSIQLAVEPSSGGLLISWPPEQTSGVSHALIRINDGAPVELPADAKKSGRWQIQSTSDNVKIELIAQHTLGKSVGIIRYIQPIAEQ